MKRKAHAKTPAHQWLVDLVNEAGKQLREERPDLGAIESLYERRPDANRDPPSLLVSLADQFRDGLPELPSGPAVKSLSLISEASGGMYGLWVIGGEPGLGKSAIARQIAAHAAMVMPVLDYDFENGPEIIAARLAKALGPRFPEVTRRWYVRESIQTLDDDLAQVGGRAMVLVDSFQSLPAVVEHAVESLAKWVRRFERLAREGHFVLLISEKNRAHYGDADLAGFKGSGALEYKAWFGVQFLGDPEDEEAPIEVHVVKNRHRRQRGHICNLVRDSERVFWFREVDAGEEEWTD